MSITLEVCNGIYAEVHFQWDGKEQDDIIKKCQEIVKQLKEQDERFYGFSQDIEDEEYVAYFGIGWDEMRNNENKGKFDKRIISILQNVIGNKALSIGKCYQFTSMADGAYFDGSIS